MAEPRQQPAPRAQPEPRVQSAPVARTTTARPVSAEVEAAVERIKAQQAELAANGFSTPVDGKWGPDTQAKWDAYQAEKRAKAEQASRQFEAQAKSKQQAAAAKAAEAQARAAEAQARAEETTAKSAADRAEAERKAAFEKGQRDAERAQHVTAARVAAAVIGTGAGIALSSHIERKTAASLAAKAAELTNAARQIERQIKRVEKSFGGGKTQELKKLRGMVASADKLGLTKFGSPKIKLLIGAILGEGAFSVANSFSTDDPVLREVLQEVGGASVVAAISLAGKQSIAAQLPKSLPDSAAAASIEAARKLTDPRPAKMRPGIVGKAVDAVVGPPLPKPRTPRAPAAPKAAPPLAATPPAVVSPLPPPIPKLGPATAAVLKAAPKASAGRALGILGIVAAAASLALTARSDGAVAAIAQGAKILDPTAGAAGRLIDAVTAAPAAPSLQDLAKQQAAERAAATTSPMATLAREAAEAQLAPGQAELGQRVLAAGGGGLEGFYQGAQPQELADRAKFQVMAADFAREANSKAPEPAPSISAVAGPAPVVETSGSSLRGWANPKVQEAAQKARREKGLI